MSTDNRSNSITDKSNLIWLSKNLFLLRTFCRFIVKQEAIMPSTAWNDIPDVIVQGEWLVGRPGIEFPEIGKKKSLLVNTAW